MRGGWKLIDLGQISDFQGGSQPPKSQFVNEARDGYIRLLQIRDFKSDDHAVYVPISKKNRTCQSSDIMIGRYGASVGQIHRGKSGAYNVALIKTTPREDLIDKEFFYLYLLSDLFQRPLRSVAARSAQAGFSKSEISSFKVPLPLLPEQKRIVAILDEAFEGIKRAVANTEKNLANARELFESYLNAVFTQKGEGWVETVLGKLCWKVEYGSSSKSKAEGSIPVLRMGNIQNGRISWNNLVYTDGAEEIDKYLLRKNDVLFNRTNSAELVGKTAIYKGERPAIFAGYLIRIHRKEDLIDADFLNYYLNSALAREYGKTVMSRSINQANINGTKLKQYPISIPTLQKQQEIVKRLRDLEMKTQYLEAIYQQKLTALAELKQSLLQKAFSGKLTADHVEKVADEIVA